MWLCKAGDGRLWLLQGKERCGWVWLFRAKQGVVGQGRVVQDVGSQDRLECDFAGKGRCDRVGQGKVGY